MENKKTLDKAIAPILGIATITACFLILWYLLLGNWPESRNNMAFAIVGYVSGYISSILSFYFGSSQSSSRKDDVINKMQGNSPTAPNTTTTNTTTQSNITTPPSDEPTPQQ